MQITNKYDLPPAIYQAVSGMTRKPKPFIYHVTELIQNPLIRKLKMQYWDELEEDASERLWALLGSSTHHVLHMSGDVLNALMEEGLQYQYGSCVVRGTPDILHDTSLEDYKVTSVYSFLLGDKPEWEKQLNIYAYMLENDGFKVERARIHAILRDWQKSKSLREPDYPPIPFQTIPINLWSRLEQQDYVIGRINLFCDVDAGVFEPMPCTDEERWARPTTYAVMKKGRKTAVRVLTTREEAEAKLATLDSNHYIDERKGSHIRCESYCPVRAVCQYNQTRIENYIEAINE